MLLHYRPGDAGYTHSRSGVASYRGAGASLQEAADGVLRDDHYVYNAGGVLVRSTLLEASRTNLVTESQDITSWTTSGTPTTGSGEDDPEGGSAAYLLGDDDGAAQEAFYIVTSFTGDAAKAVSVILKEGDSAPAGGSRVAPGVQSMAYMDNLGEYSITRRLLQRTHRR